MQKSEQTVATLANAAEATRLIVQRILGNDVADTIAGSPIKRAQLYDATMAQAQVAVHNQVGKGA